jgi:hypothetical protein
MPENDSEAVAEFIRTRGITVAQLPASCRPKATLMPADRLLLEDHAVARDRLRRDAAARNFKGPAETSLVWLYGAADARGPSLHPQQSR